MKKITPFLWFDNQAEEAMNYYLSIFKNSRALDVNRAGDKVISVTFELDGQEFIGLNAGPRFQFTEAISFYVNCENQQEVDYYWSRLTAEGGEESMCGWLKDKYGLWWQIIPTALPRLLGDPDPERAQRAMNAMLQMRKIDVQGLEQAASDS